MVKVLGNWPRDTFWGICNREIHRAITELHRQIEADYRQQLRALGTHRMNVVAVIRSGGPSYQDGCLLYPRGHLRRIFPAGWVAPLP